MSIWQQLFTKRMLICVFTGFASGLPLFLLFNLVPAWLRSEQIDLKTIGLFALNLLVFLFAVLFSTLAIGAGVPRRVIVVPRSGPASGPARGRRR